MSMLEGESMHHMVRGAIESEVSWYKRSKYVGGMRIWMLVHVVSLSRSMHGSINN